MPSIGHGKRLAQKYSSPKNKYRQVAETKSNELVSSREPVWIKYSNVLDHNSTLLRRVLLNRLSSVPLPLEFVVYDIFCGGRAFRFIRNDKRMAKVFEDFILNFYKLERRDLDVKKERLYWLATSRTDPELKRLPSMETDISVRDGTRTLIIDAKYCRLTFQSYYDSQSIHSANLYQVFVYSKNLEHKGGPDSEAEVCCCTRL